MTQEELTDTLKIIRNILEKADPELVTLRHLIISMQNYHAHPDDTSHKETFNYFKNILHNLSI